MSLTLLSFSMHKCHPEAWIYLCSRSSFERAIGLARCPFGISKFYRYNSYRRGSPARHASVHNSQSR